MNYLRSQYKWRIGILSKLTAYFSFFPFSHALVSEDVPIEETLAETEAGLTSQWPAKILFLIQASGCICGIHLLPTRIHMLVPAWVAARWKEARSEVVWHDFGARGFQFGATRLNFYRYFCALLTTLVRWTNHWTARCVRGSWKARKVFVTFLHELTEKIDISDNRKDCPNELLHLFSEGACHLLDWSMLCSDILEDSCNERL